MHIHSNIEQKKHENVVKDIKRGNKRNLVRTYLRFWLWLKFIKAF